MPQNYHMFNHIPAVDLLLYFLTSKGYQRHQCGSVLKWVLYKSFIRGQRPYLQLFYIILFPKS